MGLDKSKGLLFKTDFSHDRLSVDNLLYNEVNKSSIPFKENDVIVDKHQTVFYTVEHVLNRLLANDKFIDQYIEKTKNALSGVSKEKFISAFSQYYNIKESDVSSYYTDKLSTHNEDYHSDDSEVLKTVAKNYLKTDFSNFDLSAAKNGKFQKLSSDESTSEKHLERLYGVSLQNDVVIKTEFDSDFLKPYNYVNVAACNKNTDYAFKQHINKASSTLQSFPEMTQSTYIYKEWMSGLKEFYIYVPTTFTFYNENTDLSSIDVHNNSTFIRVKINKRHFALNHIYQAHICPQSLPLQIHNETNQYYSDVIQPSILRTMCISKEETNNVDCSFEENTSRYVLYFSCYGSDAQAIHIIGD